MSHTRSKWILQLFISTIALLSAAYADEPTYRLSYRFDVGRFYHYELEDKSVVATYNAGALDKDGLPVESKSFQHTQILKSYRVVTVDEDGSAVLEPIIEKVRTWSKSGENPDMRYDSMKDAPSKDFEKMAGAVGRAISRFHVAANGKLLKVTLLADDVPKSFSEAAKKADPAINFLVVLPEKELKIGDKWTEKTETTVSVAAGLRRSVHLLTTYELTKVDDDVASIEFRTSLLTAIQDPEILSQLVQQTPTGTIQFDLKNGKLLRRTLLVDNKVIAAFGPKTLLVAKGDSVENFVLAK